MEAAFHPHSVVAEAVLKEIESLPPSNKIRAFWEAAPEDRRPALTDAVAFKLWQISGPYLHRYPTSEIGARLILGEKPAALFPQLTKREAAAFCGQSEHSEVSSWFWKEIVRLHADVEDIKSVTPPDSVAVMRWVHDVLNDEERKDSFIRRHDPRRFPQFIAGHRAGIRVVDRLDEIKSVDLKRSPRKTLEAAILRAIDEEWGGDNELAPEEPWHKRLPPTVRVILTYSDLRQEGIEMDHCVASYASRINERESVIMSVRAESGERSTLELRNGKVHQHLGESNCSPPSACYAIVEDLKRDPPWQR